MGRACSADGDERSVDMVLVGNIRERDRWEDPGVDGRIILGWIFRKWDVGIWTGLG
jgi:pantothenate kinase